MANVKKTRKRRERSLRSIPELFFRVWRAKRKWCKPEKQFKRHKDNSEFKGGWKRSQVFFNKSTEKHRENKKREIINLQYHRELGLAINTLKTFYKEHVYVWCASMIWTFECFGNLWLTGWRGESWRQTPGSMWAQSKNKSFFSFLIVILVFCYFNINSLQTLNSIN